MKTDDNITLYDFRAVVARCKEEILADIDAGVVPASVRSFSELHDHVDANGYGGAFDWPEEEWDGDRFCDFWNHVQTAVGDWLAAGRP